MNPTFFAKVLIFILKRKDKEDNYFVVSNNALDYLHISNNNCKFAVEI